MTGRPDRDTEPARWEEIAKRAEMRWMSVEDAEITVPARVIAEQDRAYRAAVEALVFYANQNNWTQLASWGGRIHDEDSAVVRDYGSRARAALAAREVSA